MFQSVSLNLIRQADQYGAVFRPTIKLKTQYYKTMRGGLISILIYGLSLAYFIFVMYQWATDQILPNIADYKVLNAISAYHSSEKLISIQYDFPNGIIDPFDQQNIILMIVKQYYNDAYPTSNYTRIKQTNGQFNVQDFSLYVDKSDKKDKVTQECFVLVIPCDQQYLEDGEQCASKGLIQEFWYQSNFIVMKFYLQQYNTNQRQLTSFYKIVYISLNEDQTFIDTLNLQQTKTIINSGILFPDYKQYDFISDIFTQSQSISFIAGLRLYNNPVYCSLFITIDPLQLQQNIQYPNISSVLASIGSIVSSILSLKHIAKLINQRSLQEEAIFDVIKMFYPEFNDLIVKKTWLGKIKSVKNKQTNLFYNVKDYQQYYHRLAQIAEQKLCMSNTIYELSRLQFAIQLMIPKDELITLREKNLQIQLQTLKTRINSPTFRKDLSQDLDSRIKINQNYDEQESGSQQIVIDESVDKQDKQDKQDKKDKEEKEEKEENTEKQVDNHEQQLLEDDFDLFCLQRFQYVKK